MLKKRAKYHLGQVVRHRKHPFRGVVFDVDAKFSNTDEWYDAIPEESRPSKEQPFYHLLAENDQSYYVAYVSEQNLVADYSGQPVDHPDLPDLFGDFTDGHYPLHFQLNCATPSVPKRASVLSRVGGAFKHACLWMNMDRLRTANRRG